MNIFKRINKPVL